MNEAGPKDDSENLRELELIDIEDIFVSGGDAGRVRLTRRVPAVGELVRDSAGFYFLAPEEDFRGGGMGSIRLHSLGAEAKRRFVGRVVKVAGIFEDDKGLDVEAVALEDEPFADS
ncbi:MAG: hypothetical protein JRH01_00040 [Deltaproteobacteria bacterium]|nr:hypothetical protein [Deltaproteobacteria bacterium]MBW2392787.1 hypothetical protein [Deltaproteobacteria bacterium]